MQNHSTLRDILRKKEYLVICFFNFLGNGITFIFYEAISPIKLFVEANKQKDSKTDIWWSYTGQVRTVRQPDDHVQDRTIRQTHRQAADKQTVMYCRL